MTLENTRDRIKAAIAELRTEQTMISAKVVGLVTALDIVEDDIERAKRHSHRQQEQASNTSPLEPGTV